MADEIECGSCWGVHIKVAVIEVSAANFVIVKQIEAD